MPAILSTTVSKISSVPNRTNASLIAEYHKFMKETDASERHQNNSLKMVIAYAKFLGPKVTFYSIKKPEKVTTFLDTKIKSSEQDPEKKWITTWNYYLRHIKAFFRWLYNRKVKGLERTELSSCETPAFVRIREKRSKRLSPYSETDIWERDELLSIVKYETFKRNKAALTLFWDLDARNHEVTTIKIKNIRLKELYGEGEIPSNTKTGGGPILLTCSFPYVRDWLNEHPFRDDPEAKLICNLLNGNPIKPEAMWTMMKQLRKRIQRMIREGTINDKEEREKMVYLLKTKKWNPYCLRHSAITYDSDSLPEFALRKKVRWSMNSKQPARYIKRRMGENLKKQILAREGIVIEVRNKKPSFLVCSRCQAVNAVENKYCSSQNCGYPLSAESYEEVKAKEQADKEEIQRMKVKYDTDIAALREAITDMQIANKNREKLAAG